MGLVSELRRRNVFRMALLYLGAAWLIMQVVDLLIDRGPLPDSIGPITLTVLAIGLPIALIISWFYELTPEGISRDTDERPAESATGITGRRVDFVIISLLAAAALAFANPTVPVGPLTDFTLPHGRDTQF
jgi:adenylate cyclase